MSFITTIYVVISFCILLATHKQANIAKTNADAALLNAQAIIHAERPWIMVTATPDSSNAGSYIFRATVKGRTPAKITGGYIGQRLVRRPIEELRIPPEFDSEIIAPPEVLLLDTEGFDIYPGGINVGSIVRQKRDDVHFDRNQFICFYGKIVYEDVFPKGRKDYMPHETGWCYGCFLDEPQIRLRPTGPWEYRQHT